MCSQFLSNDLVVSTQQVRSIVKRRKKPAIEKVRRVLARQAGAITQRERPGWKSVGEREGNDKEEERQTIYGTVQWAIP